MTVPKHHEQFYFTFVTFLVSRYWAAMKQLTLSPALGRGLLIQGAS
jgi:hypothetical protein